MDYSIQLMTQAEVLAEIPLLASDAKSVQTRIHVAACSTLDHIREHGDTRGAVALMNGLPNGQRVKSLGHWYRVFSNGKVAFRKDKTTGEWTVELGKNRAKDGSDFNVAGAIETSFADLTEEKDPVSLTLKKFVDRMVALSTNDELHDNGARKVALEARNAAAEVVAFLTEKGYRKAA